MSLTPVELSREETGREGCFRVGAGGGTLVVGSFTNCPPPTPGCREKGTPQGGAVEGGVGAGDAGCPDRSPAVAWGPSRPNRRLVAW